MVDRGDGVWVVWVVCLGLLGGVNNIRYPCLAR